MNLFPYNIVSHNVLIQTRAILKSKSQQKIARYTCMDFNMSVGIVMYCKAFSVISVTIGKYDVGPNAPCRTPNCSTDYQHKF